MSLPVHSTCRTSSDSPEPTMAQNTHAGRCRAGATCGADVVERAHVARTPARPEVVEAHGAALSEMAPPSGGPPRSASARRTTRCATPRSGASEPRAFTPTVPRGDVHVADDEDVGQLLELRAADPRPEGLVGLVGLGANLGRRQESPHLFRVRRRGRRARAAHGPAPAPARSGKAPA